VRILYHHRTASKDGQEVHIRELIGALRALGNEVLVMGPGGDPFETKEAGAMGGQRGGLGRLRRFVPDAWMPLANRAYEALFTRRLRDAARSFRPDVIYERHALSNTVGSRVARELELPLLLEVNAPLAREEFEQGRLPALEPALSREMAVLNGASAILAVTNVLRDILTADGTPASRISVIHNGASRELLEAPADRGWRTRFGINDELVLGFVGFPRPWHGLDRVIRALAESQEGALSRARFWLAGEGPAVNDLVALANQLGVRERLHVLGVLGRRDVVPFLDAIDIALQPAATRYASPLKLFEYLARGVAVIAPRQPNVCEIVADERSALLFDAADPTDFARQLARLATDAELRTRLGAGGRARIAEAGYTWEDNAVRVAAIAAACVERRPR